MATSKMQRRKPGEHPVSQGTDKSLPNLVLLGVSRISREQGSARRIARRRIDRSGGDAGPNPARSPRADQAVFAASERRPDFVRGSRGRVLLAAGPEWLRQD